MPKPSQFEVTQILGQISAGDSAAATDLLPLVYDELRALASHYMQSERIGHTLEATALVHEAYVRLVGSGTIEFNGRQHFFAVAARAMRRLLVNHARDRQARKRGGPNCHKVTIQDVAADAEMSVIDVLDLHDAIESLAKLSGRQAQLCELRFFGGLEISESAQLLGVGLSTAKRDWTIARAWLANKLEESKR